MLHDTVDVYVTIAVISRWNAFWTVKKRHIKRFLEKNIPLDMYVPCSICPPPDTTGEGHVMDSTDTLYRVPTDTWTIQNNHNTIDLCLQRPVLVTLLLVVTMT